MTQTPSSEKPTVAVVGGGLAGISAAIQLQKAGFAVTLFEASNTLGGNTSSCVVDGVEHDVYPHMFCDWYANFWNLFEGELGRKREDRFEPHATVKMRVRDKPDYVELHNPTSIPAVIANLGSGALMPAQMFLLGYADTDLVAFPFDRSGRNQLQMLDVNGYLYSRGYGTEPVAKMANYIIKLIWSINSEKTAAATYQNFLRHSSQFPSHAPFAWLLKGGMGSELVTPLHQHLEKLGCVVQCNTSVTQLLLVDDKPCLTISTVANRENDTACQTIQYDHAVLAVPVEALAGIAFNGGADQIGKTLVESEPSLANLQKMGSVVIPVVDLYLKEKLPDFPKDNIGLAGSTFGLSVLDLSQLWDKVDFGGKTALVVAASDGDSIPSKDLQPQGHAMLRELQEYFPEIKPGKAWGDAAANIDWTKTNVRDNRRHRLFLNDVGSWEWRPPAYFPATLPRIAFAGDFCRNEVDMATIEGAVISGISAARAIQMADAALHGGKERGQPIQAKGHVVYSDAATRAMRQLMLPVAYGALGLAAVDEYIENLTDENRLHQGNHYPLLDYMAVVPLQFTIDWWKGAYWLARSLATRDPHLPPPRQSADEALFEKGRKQDGPTIQPSEITFQPGQPVDEEIGVGAALLMVAGECADYAISLLNDGKLGPAAKAAADIAAKAAADIAGRAAAGSSTSAAADMAAGAIDLAQTVLGTLLAGAAGAAKGAEAYKRRARIKN